MTKEVSYRNKPWLKNYEEGVPENISIEKTSLPDFLERTSKEFPDKMALNFQGFTINYRELNDMVNRFAACLNSFGIKKGDSVAILFTMSLSSR